jgi:ADP-dependent NAD(P)H-hydrate dehydratase / NAD(P)H-hydrate epimerase
VQLMTSEEMAALDSRAATEYGVSTLTLMEAAGRRVFEVASRLISAAPSSGTPRVAVVAGKGSNGGDGLVAARLMHEAGWSVIVILLARDPDVSGDAGNNLLRARKAGVDISNLDSTGAAGLRGTFANATVIIDGLFGTGFRGPAVGLPAKAMEAMNASGRPILAIDIPSGVQGDTGALDGQAVRATATVTLGLPKVGLVLGSGAGYAGKIWVADIGHPRRLLDGARPKTQLVTYEMVRDIIPSRRADAHKGDFGHVLVLGGSVGRSGAPVLASRGALRAGAGLVTVGVPASIYNAIGAAVIEGMPVPLPDVDGGIAADAAARVRDLLTAANVVACGPGLGTQPGAGEIVRVLLEEARCPLVLDADALNLIARMTSLPPAAGPRVLTPHPGEMARLLDATVEEIQRHRLQVARVAAERFRAVVVLKGARTVVADPGGDMYVIPTGNPAMATGGMGDVLTGTIAALIGQGLAPIAAAWSGAYLHGLAGDLAQAARGPMGVLAREVADAIPSAVARVRSGDVAELVTKL